jgi:excinuclease UvrABC ATPase subunit
VLTVVTGVAGSGKSTLVHGFVPAVCPEVVRVDQSPIRASGRSMPATFTGILDPIRALFAAEHAVPAALFSPNSEGAGTPSELLRTVCSVTAEHLRLVCTR